MTADIPAIPNIEPSWLTERLLAAGFKGCEVASLSNETIGTGQTAACSRIAISYAHPDSDAPATLIAKYPSASDLSRDSAVAMGIYRREVEFYRDVAPKLTMALPAIYYADIDAQGAHFLILMEDLAPAEPGDQLKGCTPEVAHAAVMELVGLQAPTWCDAQLARRLTEPEGGFFSDMHGLYNQMLPGFLDRFAGSLTADEVAIISQVGASPAAPLFQPMGTPFCLEHRDYRLDNLLIDETADPPRVIVVDWQGLRMGRPLNDVALCLAGGLDPVVRRRVEEDILRAYHAALLNAGVTDLDWASCWQEYRRASFAGFGLTVVAAMTVEQTPRGDAMFTAMAQRYARHALDMNAEAFLQ